MSIIIGSARHDENNKYAGGKDGDQLQTSSTNDMSGEVSMQSFYVHSKGWDILRPKSVSLANEIANGMKTLCNNANKGYDQNAHSTLVDISSTTKQDTDCSGGIRSIIKKVASTDVGAFSTATEKTVLVNSGLFTYVGAFTSQSATPVYNGDVLVTKTKGHTVVVVSGNPRTTTSTVPTLANPTIKKGSTGTEAKNLQQDLNYVASAGLEVDGKFGSNSVAALKKWQAAAGLTADGVYGSKSYAIMKNLID